MRKNTRVADSPEGLRYRAEVLSPEAERELVEHIRELPLKEFEFHGYIGKRRTLSYGWHYDFGEARLKQTEVIPGFLHSARGLAATFAGLQPQDLPHALVTEYSPGTPIGWHRDKGVFGDVVGVSLLSSCVFRLRRRTGASSWERYSFTAEPRSMYLLRGKARTEWEHSIPAVEDLRYSITFRSLRSKP